MSTFDEIKELPDKFKKYQDQVIELFNAYNINSIQLFVKNYRNNEQFKKDWNKLWIQISKVEGGKLSLTTIGIIMGSALGGVGIAAMGSAIGLPLALVLGLGGFVSGSKFDSLNFFGSKKRVSIKLSKELLRNIESDAKESGVSVSDYVEIILQQAYAESI